MTDAVFEHPRLTAIYDALDPDRSDLEVYAALVDELGAHTVLDIGCGTGTFALLLAGRGLAVTAVDPAAGMLGVARAKPGAEQVTWLHCTAACDAAGPGGHDRKRRSGHRRPRGLGCHLARRA